jgi:tetraacyldisaccharide 4'-kinase
MSRWRYILWPLAWVYAVVLVMRHWLYNCGVFKSENGAVKTLVFGNVAVGGTGKTPHVAFVMNHFGPNASIAFLSRGYGRKTKGFLPIETWHHAADVGDEPKMLSLRYPKVPCFVSEDRVGALQRIQKSTEPSWVVLDDALQHRALKPDCSVLLTTWQRPFFDDNLLPVGQLRDLPSRAKSADALIVTKCPAQISVEEQQLWKSKLASAGRPVFFTTITYNLPIPLHAADVWETAGATIVVTGIANPEVFVEEMGRRFQVMQHFAYRDHHEFSAPEVATWAQAADSVVQILTTEKDATRMISMELPAHVKVFYVPIEIDFIGEHTAVDFLEWVTQRMGGGRAMQ